MAEQLWSKSFICLFRLLPVELIVADKFFVRKTIISGAIYYFGNCYDLNIFVFYSSTAPLLIRVSVRDKLYFIIKEYQKYNTGFSLYNLDTLIIEIIRKFSSNAFMWPANCDYGT